LVLISQFVDEEVNGAVVLLDHERGKLKMHRTSLGPAQARIRGEFSRVSVCVVDDTIGV
jgi:hypothetical protein